MKKRKWWSRVLVALALLGLCVVSIVIGLQVAPGIGGYAYEYCVWSADTAAWIDENENGTWDGGESPLAGVEFHVNDTLNGYDDVDVLDSSVSNDEGLSHVSVHFPGCPDVQFEVYAVPPSGYRLTTDSPLTVEEQRDSYEFGFISVDS